MLTTILLTLAALAAALGFITAIEFHSACTVLKRHLASRPPRNAVNNSPFTAWQKQLWQNQLVRLNKIRMRSGLTALGAYVVGAAALIPAHLMLQATATNFCVVLLLSALLCVSVIAVGISATTHFRRRVELGPNFGYRHTIR